MGEAVPPAAVGPPGPESCGFNAPDRGCLRANVTWPFAKVRFAAIEGTLVVDTPSVVMPQLSYTFTPDDTSAVVPLTASGLNPLRSGGVAIRDSTGAWFYIWCTAPVRERLKRLLTGAGFRVASERLGVLYPLLHKGPRVRWRRAEVPRTRRRRTIRSKDDATWNWLRN